MEMLIRSSIDKNGSKKGYAKAVKKAIGKKRILYTGIKGKN